jgi:hypothetical protein
MHVKTAHVHWHTDSLDMVVLPSTGALHYLNCCIDGGTSPEYFGYTLVFMCVIPYILESNMHPGFGDLLNGKKLVRNYNMHLSFIHPTPTWQLTE